MKTAYIEVILMAQELNKTGKVNEAACEELIKKSENHEHVLLVQAIIKIADMMNGF